MTTDDEKFEQIVQADKECDHEHNGPCVTAQEVFGFDPADKEQCHEVSQWTMGLFEAACTGDRDTAVKLSQKVFGTGPDGLFVSFTTLAAIAQTAVSTAFGEDTVDPESSTWRMGMVCESADGEEEIPDLDPEQRDELEAQEFAGSFMTAYMNDDEPGAKAMFQTKVMEEFPRVVAAHSAMMMQTRHILYASAEHNPEAFIDYALEEIEADIEQGLIELTGGENGTDEADCS